MSLKRRLIINASWLFAGQTIQKGLSYLIILLISRTLGSAGLGQYSFVVSFTGFVSYLSDFGINYYLMREIARDKENKRLVPYALGFKLILAFLDWLLIVFLALNLNKSLQTKEMIILYGAGAVLGSIGLLFTSAMFAHEVTKYETYAVSAERLMTLVIGGVVLWITRDLLLFFIVLTVDIVLLNVLRIYFGSRFVEVSVGFEPRVWLEILRYSYVFWFIYLFSFIYFNTDIVMLGLMKPDEVVGWYKAGYFFVQALMMVPSVVVNTTLPSISRLWVEDREKLRVLFKKAFQVLLVSGILSTAGLYLTAPWLLRLFFGSGFDNSVIALRILSFVVPAVFLNSLFGSFLNGTGREMTYTKIVGSAALLNVILNYVLIQSMSYRGAAIATLITNWTSTAILFLKSYNILNQIGRPGSTIKLQF